jgi:hypothetical protein
MKIIWKSLTSIGKKYKDGSTGSFTKVRSNGKTKYVKTGSSNGKMSTRGKKR